MRRILPLLILVAFSTAHAGVTRQNVRTISKSGSTGLNGNVTISEGSGVTLTQTGQDISIAATGSGGGSGGGVGSSVFTATKTAGFSVVTANYANGFVAMNCATRCEVVFPPCTASGGYKVDFINIGVAELALISAVSDKFNGDSTLKIQGSNYNAQTVVCYGSTQHYVH